MKTYTLRSLSCAAALAAALAVVPALRAEQHLTTQFSMQMQLNGKVTEIGCNNSPGPQITLEGEIILGGVQAQLIFQNNVKGTHTTTVTYSSNIVLIPLGGAITLPKQPVQGGVGGNPHIWIQLHDGDGHNLTGEIYLGRCVQGLSISPSFLSEVLAQAEVGALDCANSPGPIISVSGSAIFASGVKARFIFRNNLKGRHTAEDSRDITIIAEGAGVTIPKQPVLGGSGGNPLISLQFLDGSGDPIDAPIRLGRCNQL